MSELLQDILEAHRKSDPCYFLGSIMLIEQELNSWEINDGQQRMVTFSLICAALCRFFHRGKDRVNERDALRLLFQIDEMSRKTLLDADNLHPRLAPPQNDKIQYYPMIRNKDIGRNGKLTSAWETINLFFNPMSKKDKANFFEFLINKVEVSCLFIPQQIDHNFVFEAINNRGKKLEEFDLLRNYIYSFFDDSGASAMRDTVHHKLESILARLKSKQPAEYARCFFQSKFGYLPKDLFFRKTKEKILAQHKKGRPQHVLQLVEEFAADVNVEIYKQIINPGQNNGTMVSLQKALPRNKCHTLFTLLQEMQKYSVTHSIVFSYLNALSMSIEKDSSNVAKSKAKFIFSQLMNLNAFVMRTVFVSPSFQPSHYDAIFSNLASKIAKKATSGDLSDVQIIDELKNCDNQNIIEDASFTKKLSDIEIRESDRAKLFLSGLVRITQPDGSQMINSKECTLEHVLPKSDVHVQGWGFDERQFKDNRYKLGNLSLLSKKDNKPDNKSNASFLAKRPAFANSSIQLTRDIADWDKWTPAEVAERQNILIAHAVKAWAFS